MSWIDINIWYVTVSETNNIALNSDLQTPFKIENSFQILLEKPNFHLYFSATHKLQVFWEGQSFLTLLNKVKKIGNVFKILWPSQNIWTSKLYNCEIVTDIREHAEKASTYIKIYGELQLHWANFLLRVKILSEI